jgi:hypothetical protein
LHEVSEQAMLRYGNRNQNGVYQEAGEGKETREFSELTECSLLIVLCYMNMYIYQISVSLKSVYVNEHRLYFRKKSLKKN